jgi:hypothetical protein
MTIRRWEEAVFSGKQLADSHPGLRLHRIDRFQRLSHEEPMLRVLFACCHHRVARDRSALKRDESAQALSVIARS